MQKGNVKLAAVTAAVIVILLLFSWQWAPSDDGVSSDFADAVAGGDAEAAYASLVPELREQYEQLGGLEYFQTQMSALGAQNVLSYGPLVSVGDSYEPGAEGISCTYMEYAYSGMLMWTHETEAGVDSFYMTPRDLPSSEAVPVGITETPVKVGAEGMTGLDGLIASSDDSDHRTAAVLVSGSGPNGMNCAIGHSQIFALTNIGQGAAHQPSGPRSRHQSSVGRAQHGAQHGKDFQRLIGLKNILL